LTETRTILVGIYSRRYPAWNIPAGSVDWLRQTFPHHTFLHARNEDEALRLIDGAEIVFTAELGPSLLHAAPHLRWVHSPAAGLGGMLFPVMIESSITLTNSRGLSADTIAEHVLSVILAIFRKLPRAFESQRAREWAQSAMTAGTPLQTVAGSRVLIVGLGAIGMATAERLASLSARVDAVRRRADSPRPSYIERVVSPDHLHDLLPSADVVVLAAPQTAKTRHLIGHRELRAMRRGSVLVNVSRGALVDEAALIDALGAPPSEQTVTAAALDVFEHEPLPVESPLWTLPNVLITPHVAGFRPDHWEAVTALFADNLRRFEAGQPLINVVDKREGY
jgi:phosphoglycerate dehydrogenase-like enzyme